MGNEKTSGTTAKAETKAKPPTDQDKASDTVAGAAQDAPAAPTFDQDAAVVAILANPQFVDGVGNIVAEYLKANPPAPAETGGKAAPIDVGAAVDAYLDKNLETLVKASMPESPDQARDRERKEAADRRREADEARAGADKRAEKARVKEAEKVEKERGEQRQASRQARETLLSSDSADPDAGDFDIAEYDIGKLFLDDGDHFSIDFSHRVTSAQLERVDGNGLLLKAKPMTIGEGIGEAFQVCAVVLTLQADDAPTRVFRCKLPNPVTIGGGAKAQLGENSLVFRPV